MNVSDSHKHPNVSDDTPQMTGTLAFKHLPEDIKVLHQVAQWNKVYWSLQYPEVYTDFDFDAFYESASKVKMGLPACFISELNGELAGTISIIHEKVPMFAEFNPWIANLYVREDFRNQGIGDFMMQMAFARAEDLGYKKVYGWGQASMEKYYHNQGWVTVSSVALSNDRRILVFEKTL